MDLSAHINALIVAAKAEAYAQGRADAKNEQNEQQSAFAEKVRKYKSQLVAENHQKYA